ncbi:protein translocase subunit SecF [Corynebacterium ulceribovis]|uniref:protein translocase subunit SecF n=1 Tax=Corynebacterium ulceribovis TaxID=487732 RepID=UPI000361B5A2|nr:protein translocase subunit SecF [Corynebacterium ulceribovis]
MTEAATTTQQTRKQKNTLSGIADGISTFNFIGNTKRIFVITGVILLLCLGGMAIRGFNFGIDFQGGTKMTLPAASIAEDNAADVFTEATGVEPQQVQIVGQGDARILEITSERLSEEETTKARLALYEEFKPLDASGQVSPDAVGDSTVSESWGSSITKKMVIAMGVFLGLVFLYIMVVFSRDMAIAAIAALAVDGIVIAGFYALFGFEVTPATVIGLLTVLSFSLYDTVVVFDKVQELTAGFHHQKRNTYGELVNRAVNETIMRSVSTTVISVLPIAALMVIAVWLLGVGTLADLALVQFIGIIEGVFSSIFLASPILVWLHSKRAAVQKHNREVEAERSGTALIDGSSDAASEENDEAQSSDKAPRRQVVVETPTAPETGGTWRPGQ